MENIKKLAALTEYLQDTGSNHELEQVLTLKDGDIGVLWGNAEVIMYQTSNCL